jgi:hypothetical protein
MRFRGGGVGHTSTRAATNTFKKDRDALDLKFRQRRASQEQLPVSDVKQPEDADDCMSAEDSDDPVDEGQLSESELLDYGYGQGSDSEEEEGQDEEEEDVEAGEEDNDVDIDDLAMLGYADF